MESHHHRQGAGTLDYVWKSEWTARCQYINKQRWHWNLWETKTRWRKTECDRDSCGSTCQRTKNQGTDRDGCYHLPDGLLKEVVIDRVHYTITPLDEPKEASVSTTLATVPFSLTKRSEILDEVLTMPVVKRKKTLGIRLSKILRCISSKEFQNIMREKEEAKQKEEKKKRNAISEWDKQWLRRRSTNNKWS